MRKRTRFLGALLAVMMAAGLAPAALAGELALTPEFSLVSDAAWVEEDITLYYCENEQVHIDQSSGYFAIGSGTPITVANVGDENDYVHIYYEPYTMQTESMEIYCGAANSASNREPLDWDAGTHDFKGEYLCYNGDFTCAYYLNQDGGWSKLEPAIINMVYMGKPSERIMYGEMDGLLLEKGESVTFTLPDEGTDTYYLLWVASYNDDTDWVQWQYTEFRNVDSASPAVAGFSDVHESDYYADAVAWAVDNGVTTGTSATAFSPDNTVTRAEAVTFLWRAAGSPEPSSPDSPFADVSDPSAYYYKAVLWAAEQGVTNGVSATAFGLSETLTYDQILAMLCRAAGGTASGSDWSAQAVNWAAENGLTEGLTFTAAGSCPRCDVIYCLWKQLA